MSENRESQAAVKMSEHQVDAVIHRALPPWRHRAIGLSFGVLADICVVGLMALSMWLIVRAGEQPPILHMTFAIVGVRAFAIGRAAFRYAERLASHDAAFAQLATLRTDTFQALIPRVPGAIESRRRGDVLTAFVDDVDQLQDEMLRVCQPITVSVIVVALSIAVLAIVSPLAALILAAMLLGSGALAAWASGRISAVSDRELSQARSALTDALLERFSAAEALAAYGALDLQRQRIQDAENWLAAVQTRRVRAAGLTGSLLSLAAGLATVLILVSLAPALHTGGGISAPIFAAAVIVPAAVFEVFAQTLSGLVARRTVRASALRVAELTETPLPPEIPVDPAEPRVEPDIPGAPLLAVQDLSVRHPGALHPALSGLTFELQHGRTLVISGESGIGKSTLALALVRLLDYEGTYRLNGVEARDLTASAVRRKVGLIEQTPHLFDADLRQNLKFARDTASDEDLLAVLDRVGLGTWATDRGGLDAAVGERGALVSGGQAQRIALARAILADFPVLILDEPTAGVDRELADKLLTELLRAVPEDRAVILITHTELPSTVQYDHLRLERK